MAESKGALIAKTVQKHAGRAKEKVSAAKRHTYICTFLTGFFGEHVSPLYAANKIVLLQIVSTLGVTYSMFQRV